jgi:hypothetical protein
MLRSTSQSHSRPEESLRYCSLGSVPDGMVRRRRIDAGRSLALRGVKEGLIFIQLLLGGQHVRSEQPVPAIPHSRQDDSALRQSLIDHPHCEGDVRMGSLDGRQALVAGQDADDVNFGHAPLIRCSRVHFASWVNDQKRAARTISRSETNIRAKRRCTKSQAVSARDGGFRGREEVIVNIVCGDPGENTTNVAFLSPSHLMRLRT